MMYFLLLAGLVSTTVSAENQHDFRQLQTSASYLKDYKKHFGKDIWDKCKFLDEEEVPVTGDKCKKLEEGQMCGFGSQECLSEVVPKSSVHPTTVCTCGADQKFVCERWDPGCYESTATITECPAEMPDEDFDETCVEKLKCKYGKEECCSDEENDAFYQCKCKPEGQFKCKMKSKEKFCKKVECETPDEEVADESNEPVVGINPFPGRPPIVTENSWCPRLPPTEGDSCDDAGETCHYDFCEFTGQHLTSCTCGADGMFGVCRTLKIACPSTGTKDTEPSSVNNDQTVHVFTHSAQFLPPSMSPPDNSWCPEAPPMVGDSCSKPGKGCPYNLCKTFDTYLTQCSCLEDGTFGSCLTQMLECPDAFVVNPPDPMNPPSCPAKEPLDNAECDVEGVVCGYGEVCCCGDCSTKLSFTCKNGSLGAPIEVARRCSNEACSSGAAAEMTACPATPPLGKCDIDINSELCSYGTSLCTDCATMEQVESGPAESCGCTPEGDWECWPHLCPASECESPQSSTTRGTTKGSPYIYLATPDDEPAPDAGAEKDQSEPPPLYDPTAPAGRTTDVTDFDAAPDMPAFAISTPDGIPGVGEFDIMEPELIDPDALVVEDQTDV